MLKARTLATALFNTVQDRTRLKAAAPQRVEANLGATEVPT
jgi:hypothetical protein